MRINKLKLSGFKSFVDPTTLNLPNRLTGVVGPNGCGKSNVIDAVLWVLGESSAKHLRGDAMSDVIFSGSNARKPVGQASVEIVFDNSDGKIGGEYARFNEIAIKRQLGRDGVSIYTLNGSRCRRKDITNLFLGTGIGPRSYSVIEQGMISRVIESKPEDLRVFLEEAAGISKYKERRRETENRIRHSKENLERLSDIRDELGKQLNRLERQAKAAERYKNLKAEERQVKAQLTALLWQDLQQQSSLQSSQIAQAETQVEAAIADVRSTEAGIEKDHQAQVSANDQFNQIQGRFYGLATEISGLEQAIQHANERRDNLQADSQRLNAELTENQQQIDKEQQILQTSSAELETLEPRQVELLALEKQATLQLEQSEQAAASKQAEWDDFQQSYSEHTRLEQNERSKITHLQRALENTQKRMARLNAEKLSIEPEQLGFNLDEMQSNLSSAEQLYESLEAKRTELQGQIQSARQQVQSSSSKLDESRHEYQTIKGRLSSLEALQQSALGQDQTQLHDLLEQKGLADTPKLAQEISVESGWESALEVVLGEHLDSLCIADLSDFSQQLSGLNEGVVGGIEQSANGVKPIPSSNSNERLLDKVSSSLPLETLMPAVYVTTTLDQAMELRKQLAAHESIVTKEGDRIGPSWLRVKRKQQEQTGVLEREREIRQLTEKSSQLEAQIDELSGLLDQHRQQRGQLESEAANLLREMDSAQKHRAGLSSELAASKASYEQSRTRLSHLEQELSELLKSEQAEERELTTSQQNLAQLSDKDEQFKQQRQVLLAHREEQNLQISELRQAWRKNRDQTHELALRSESLGARKSALEQSIQRYQTQQQQLQQRTAEIQAEVDKGQQPIITIQENLEQVLAKRLAVEGELNTARENLQQVEQQLKQGEQKRQSFEQVLQTARQSLEQLRLDGQSVSVKLQGLNDQLQTAGYEAEKLLAEMPEAATEVAWQERIDGLERKISRLGPINLAAIDECKELSDRKVFLDQQNDDLLEALSTLESAIRKIDKETRGRFKDIYDQVNSGFQAMFPRLFGGGQAHLELTGEDLLETGISVIAQPPGKRNSSIHLLSGGEKALTAVSLVFAIFQLNPAPFCLLDEVDAPLDDANVVRLCDMLQEMSDQVQFIFISHNKITMEIAQQLIGVTMQEAGVSRLVSVDMDEAVEMVATA